MKQSAKPDRRSFLQGFACLPLAGALNTVATVPLQAQPAAPRFDYATADSAIHVFAVDGERRIRIQSVTSRSPVALAFHPNGTRLYVANEVDEYRGLPQGTVEAYSINRGRLTLLNRQPLSLSATMPRHLAVSLDGCHLVVAVYGGGAYNVLPIGEDGELGRVSGMLKELGSGSHPEHQSSAHPHSVIFDTTGRRVISTDFGCDRLNVFEIESGTLIRRSRRSVVAGKGPGHLAIHVSGSLLYVLNELDFSVSCHPYDVLKGTIAEQLHSVSLRGEGKGALPDRAAVTLDPSGHFLFVSTLVGPDLAWKINQSSGELTSWLIRETSNFVPRFC